MNETLTKLGDGGIAAAVIGAIVAYSTNAVQDIRVVYCLTALGGLWMLCRTAIKMVRVWKGQCDGQ